MSRDPVTPQSVTIDDLAARFQVILLDAYGVLVDGVGALPEGRAMLRAIRARGREFLIVTNDSSRSPASVARRFAGFDLDVPAERIVTSGSLLVPYFAEHGLHDARCMVLGPDDSRAYVRAAGGRIAPIAADSDIDAVIIGDDEGYDFLPGVEAALSAVARQLNRGREVALVLPNPDLVFPKSAGVYGYTSGAVALLIEAGLARLFPGRAADPRGGGIRFARLGKPHTPIFARARALAGTDSLVMVGDQLQTDIAGANAAGIASALVATGVSQWRAPEATTNASPEATIKASPNESPGPSIKPDFLLE